MVEIKLKVKLGNLTLKSPLLTASGTSGSGDEAEGLRRSKEIINALGAFVTKGVTLKPRAGNPDIRVIETRTGLLNSIGLQNKGVERFAKSELPNLLKYELPIIVNISASQASEYGILTSKLLDIGNKYISGIEINVSCPNINEGGVSFAANPKLVENIVLNVKRALPKDKKILLITKLSPNVTDITVSAKAAIAGGTDALSMINTVRGIAINIKQKKPFFRNVVAGLSGPAIKPIGIFNVYECFKRIPECKSKRIPIIGIGGINAWQDVIEYILAGASAVGIGTAWFVYPEIFIDIKKGLVAYLQEHRCTLASLIGKANA